LHRSARARAHEWHVDTGRPQLPNKTLAALAQISTPSAAHFLKSHQLLVQKVAADPNRQRSSLSMAMEVDLLDAKERTAMHHAMHQVLTTLAATGAHRCFGVCQDCTYLRGETRCNLTSASSSAPECLLLGVPIEPEDVDLLCVHFRPTSEHNDGAHELTSAIRGKDT
jgi:hypothetical protein